MRVLRVDRKTRAPDAAAQRAPCPPRARGRIRDGTIRTLARAAATAETSLITGNDRARSGAGEWWDRLAAALTEMSSVRNQSLRAERAIGPGKRATAPTPAAGALMPEGGSRRMVKLTWGVAATRRSPPPPRARPAGSRPAHRPWKRTPMPRRLWPGR